jgi:hypothetical protein
MSLQEWAQNLLDEINAEDRRLKQAEKKKIERNLAGMNIKKLIEAATQARVSIEEFNDILNKQSNT